MSTRSLRSAPQMLPLYLRAAAQLVPGATHLPGVPGGTREIPDVELVLEGAEVNRGRLDAYCDVCGFDSGATLPPTYPHILAFPLHMALMTDSRFPFGPIGLVHIENEIITQRALRPSDAFDLRVRATPLEPHPKGKTFAIVTEARVREELVWSERSKLLSRGEGTGVVRRTNEQLSGSELWDVRGDIGRRYGSASGDRNPIHLNALSARAFGFRRAIAHGMWGKARCLARLTGELTAAFTTSVEFRKPILLPTTVAFGSVRSGAATSFALRDPSTGALHLRGRIERNDK